jgi:hypothetical protein
MSNRHTPWRIYCRLVKLGGGSNILYRAAMTCIELGGATPAECRKRLQARLETGKIDEESYRTRSEDLEQIAEMYKYKMSSGYDPCKTADGWEPMKNGCHHRKNMKGDML